jgi:hypothetical protein
MTKLNKWRRAGSVGYERILARGSGWVYLKRAGMKAAGLDYPARKPNWSVLKHIYAVNQARLLLDYEFWKEERQIKADREFGSEQPIPDAEMWLDGDAEDDPIAVEVQRSHLKVEKFVEKLERLTTIFAYRRVQLCVPDEKIAAAAARACEKLSFSDQEKVRIAILPLEMK